MSTTSQPSKTALFAAAARAAHLIVDGEPVIFADSLAAPLLGRAAEKLIGFQRAHGEEPVLVNMRTQMVCRSRVLEDRVAAGVAAGIDQYVILGAGLDSFAYRSEVAGPLRPVRSLPRGSGLRWPRVACSVITLAICEPLKDVQDGVGLQGG